MVAIFGFDGGFYIMIGIGPIALTVCSNGLSSSITWNDLLIIGGVCLVIGGVMVLLLLICAYWPKKDRKPCDRDWETTILL